MPTRFPTAWIAFVLFAGACGDETISPSPTNPCLASADDNDPARMLQVVLEAHGSVDALAPLLTTNPVDLDGVLVALFPDIAGRTLVDRELLPPAPYTGAINEAFEPVPIAFPVDWSANPLGDVSWQLWFQSLIWLDRLDADTAAFAVVDWAEHALYVDPSLNFTWSDHALALRLHAVSGFAMRYLAREGDLDREVLRAAAIVIVTHVLALASAGCYTEGQNHGVMQDIALLATIPRYPALRDGERWWQLAIDRAREQVALSVAPDGIHNENSPHYQVLYAGLVLQVLEATVAGGRAADVELLSALEGLIGGVAQQLQPNLTLAQFGDTSNEVVRDSLTNLVVRARALDGDATELDELDWILSRGERGRAPANVDAVFEQGGYAAFRAGWSTTNAESIVTAHFRAGHASHSHYHPDDTGIEIYGYGSELVLGPGVHGYDPADPFQVYQYTPAAHNVLVVDGIAEVEHAPDSASRITAHGGGDVLWVQGTHRNYRALGIGSLVRSFAYRKPDGFVVIDHVRADGRAHRYEQHFHLHPRLSDVTRSGTTVIAQTADGTGPSVTFTPTTLAELDTPRGVNEAGRMAGWHFPTKYQEEAATDVILGYDDDRDELDLPVLILVAGPGEPAPIPTNVSYAQVAGHGVLRWTIAGSERSISVPLPAPDS